MAFRQGTGSQAAVPTNTTKSGRVVAVRIDRHRMWHTYSEIVPGAAGTKYRQRFSGKNGKPYRRSRDSSSPL